jgi:hypothetical protein
MTHMSSMSDAASGVQSALRTSWILEDVYQLSDDGNAPDTISATVKSNSPSTYATEYSPHTRAWSSELGALPDRSARGAVAPNSAMHLDTNRLIEKRSIPLFGALFFREMRVHFNFFSATGVSPFGKKTAQNQKLKKVKVHQEEKNEAT